jgi:hypothetical protein
MFEIQPELKVIRVFREQIVAIIESINSPMVAAGNRPLEPAKAYILGVRNKSGRFSIFIYLHLVQSQECMIYLHSPAEIAMEQYHEIEVEALQFVETMGFMVDNMNFRNLSPEQKAQVMEALPMFHEDLREFARRGAGGAEGEASAVGEGDATEELEVIEAGEEDMVEEVVELDSEVIEPVPEAPAVPKEGLAKMIRLLSSF